MTKNVPHIYDYFHFDGEFQPENIITQFLGNDLTFGYWKNEKFCYITLTEVFDMMHSGRKVTREDFKHTI